MVKVNTLRLLQSPVLTCIAPRAIGQCASTLEEWVQGSRSAVPPSLKGDGSQSVPDRVHKGKL